VTHGKRPRDAAALREAARSVAFTPGRRAGAPPLGLRGGDDEQASRDAERALARRGVDAGREALARAGAAEPPLRGRLVRLAGRVAAETGAPELRAGLVALLADSDAKTRRNAVIALGKLGGEGLEEAILTRCQVEDRIEVMRALVAALGKVGGERALAALRRLSTEDPELLRIAAEARLLLERNVSAAGEAALDLGTTASRPLPAIARCRRGLEELLAGELEAAWRPSVRAPGEVRMAFAGPLPSPLAARTLLGWGFLLPAEPLGKAGPGEAIGRALTSPAAREVLSAFTRGTVRYRIEWASGGKHRAEIVRAAQTASARWDRLVNDPSRRDWEAVARVLGDRVEVVLEPRLDDPRFAYRIGDVPGASHPTVAAALARIGGAIASDVVWDPFVGSGTELIERARLGPWRRLVGSDRDAKAVAISEENLRMANIAGAEIGVGDALGPAPEGLTLVITNPPMGRRVLRGEDVAALAERFVDHVARALARGGRMAWISPAGERTAACARRAGLSVVEDRRVDLGGFWGALQLLKRER
jgi:predicted RNA methylase